MEEDHPKSQLYLNKENMNYKWNNDDDDDDTPMHAINVYKGGNNLVSLNYLT